MNWQLTPPIFLLLVAGGVGGLLALEGTVRRRATPGAQPLGWLALAAAVWAWASAAEHLAGGLAAKILWSKVQYLGIVTIPACWVWFAAHYGRQLPRLTRRRMAWFLLVPALTLALVWTNEAHGLIWPRVTLAPDGQTAIYDHGAGFWLFLVFTYGALLTGTLWIWRAIRQVPQWYRGPAVLVIIGVAIPWLSNAAYLLAGPAFGGLDPTPLAFVAAGGLIAISLYQLQLLELIPIARTVVLDQMPDGVLVLDAQERVVDLNPAARRWLGADCLGRPATLAVPNWAALRAQAAGPVELTLGGRWLEARLSALPGPAGGASGWLVVLHDIGDRKVAEAALRSGEARLRQVIDLVPHLIFAKDDQGRYILANHAMAEAYGTTPAELLGRRDEEAAPSETLAHHFREEDRNVIASGAPLSIPQETFIDAQGRPRIFQTTKIPFTFSGSLTPAVLGVAIDITELKRVEAALRDSERHHRLLAENATDVIWTMDFGGRLTYISPSVEQLRGFTPEEVMGQPLEQTVAAGSLPVMMGAIQVAVQELLMGRRLPVSPQEVEQICKDGRTVWTEVLARVMYDDAGRPAGILGVSREITARKQLEIENQRLMEAAQRRAVEAETLREAAAAVAATLDLDEIIPRVLVQLQRVVPYDSASVQLLRDGQMENVGGRGFADLAAVVGARIPLNGTTPNSIVFQSRRPVILVDAPQEYPAFRAPPHHHIRGWMGVPLILQDRVIGMLALDSRAVGAFTDDHARLATAFADQVAIALEQARLFHDVQRLATTDPLTNVHNRRHFMTLATLEYELACRYHHPLSSVLLDIDHFKTVNDRYGHLVGDRVLQTVAARCQEVLRRSDLLGRYGGEEFVALLPETPAGGAEQVAQRLRAQIGETPVVLEGAPPIQVTVSVGVATMAAGRPCQSSGAGAALEALIEQADQALYVAKRAGRNRVVVAGADSGEPA